jgi:hypothetical protein
MDRGDSHGGITNACGEANLTTKSLEEPSSELFRPHPFVSANLDWLLLSPRRPLCSVKLVFTYTSLRFPTGTT